MGVIAIVENNEGKNFKAGRIKVIDIPKSNLERLKELKENPIFRSKLALEELSIELEHAADRSPRDPHTASMVNLLSVALEPATQALNTQLNQLGWNKYDIASATINYHMRVLRGKKPV